MAKQSTAEDGLKMALQSVKVCKADAAQLEEKFKEEIFGKLHEKCEVSTSVGIDTKDFDAFVDHMGESYEGIGENEKKKLKGAKLSRRFTNHFMEFKYNMEKKDDMFRARYGMVALAKADNNIDCAYVLYKMDFKLMPAEQHSRLWGLIKWEVPDHEKVKEYGQIITSKSFLNFFRKKALEAFYREGVIEKINYVSS